MPVDVNIDTEDRLITYKATGDITVADMKAAFESIFNHPDFEPGMNALCDAKYASFPEMSLHEVQGLVGLLSERSASRGKDFRVALLVRGNSEFGISSLFEMQTYSLPFDVQVFRKTAEAKEWLGVRQST
jgi:hypothetical protein